jgi:hypothetical protein
LSDLTGKIGPIRLYRNLKTGERFLAAKEPNDDVVYSVVEENDRPINAGNRFPKDEFLRILCTCDIEADENTVGFTFFNGEFVKKRKNQIVFRHYYLGS